MCRQSDGPAACRGPSRTSAASVSRSAPTSTDQLRAAQFAEKRGETGRHDGRILDEKDAHSERDRWRG